MGFRFNYQPQLVSLPDFGTINSRDPYFMVYYNPCILGSFSSPIYPNQLGWPIFRCENVSFRVPGIFPPRKILWWMAPASHSCQASKHIILHPGTGGFPTLSWNKPPNPGRLSKFPWNGTVVLHLLTCVYKYVYIYIILYTHLRIDHPNSIWDFNKSINMILPNHWVYMDWFGTKKNCTSNWLSFIVNVQSQWENCIYITRCIIYDDIWCIYIYIYLCIYTSIYLYDIYI